MVRIGNFWLLLGLLPLVAGALAAEEREKSNDVGSDAARTLYMRRIAELSSEERSLVRICDRVCAGLRRESSQVKEAEALTKEARSRYETALADDPELESLQKAVEAADKSLSEARIAKDAASMQAALEARKLARKDYNRELIQSADRLKPFLTEIEEAKKAEQEVVERLAGKNPDWVAANTKLLELRKEKAKLIGLAKALPPCEDDEHSDCGCEH